jgi:adenylate cyclase
MVKFGILHTLGVIFTPFGGFYLLGSLAFYTPLYGNSILMNQSTRKLAVIVHADVVGSTNLVQLNETLAHERIRDAFKDFSKTILAYGGTPQELRGDALLATFNRASDAVSASLVFQNGNTRQNKTFDDDIRPQVRIGIALGEVVIADGTLTGPDVVLAQRIEQLAEPGGICIQGTAFETIPGRFNFEFVSLGKQQLKGFANTVRVYTAKSRPGEKIPDPEPNASTEAPPLRKLWAVMAMVLLLVATGLIAWLQPWQSEVELADPDKMSYALPDKPSIAVLPFANMSSDKEQEYFSDGITEDIITDISKISGLFVVARNSTFTYKGKAVKVRQVAEDLGVRYVLEGSVRRAGDQIRITAQLIDALTGNHVWADRYDRDLENVFKVQSEVAQQVAKALAVTLKANEIERLFQEYTTNIDAYDVFLKARRIVDQPSKDNILRGEQLFKQVIELDPNFAGGYAGLSFNYSVQIRFKYSNSPASHLAEAFELANKAIEIDPGYTWGYIALGGAHLANVDADAAVDAVRQAVILEPNGYEANLFMGFYLQFAGDAERAVEHLLVARRLSPVESVRGRAFMAMAQFMNRNYTEVVRISWASTPSGKVALAAAYTLLEEPEKAAEVVKKLLDTNPSFNLSQWKLARLRYWESEENRTRLYNAAKKAGFPEFPKGQ